MNVFTLCPVAGCRRLTTGGRCPEHAGELRARKNATARAHGTTSRRWARMRRTVLEAAGYRCQLGLPGCTGTATTVHIDPRYGGNHRLVTGLGDAVAACRRCHGRVDAPRAGRSEKSLAASTPLGPRYPSAHFARHRPSLADTTTEASRT